MGFDKIFKTHEKRAQLADGLSVAPSATEYSDAFVLSDSINVATLGFHIDTALGSSEASVQVTMGTDINGADHWITIQSPTTSGDAIFTVDDEVDKVRLAFTETGGVDGLSGISVWAKGRTL